MSIVSFIIYICYNIRYINIKEQGSHLYIQMENALFALRAQCVLATLLYEVCLKFWKNFDRLANDYIKKNSYSNCKDFN